MDCLFCKIIKGEIPSAKIYEDEHMFAFLDIRPINKGHTLVLPKEHYGDVFDIPSETLCDVMPGLKKVASAIKEAVNADGLNIGVNNGEVAGQAVFHLHFHLIPRFEDDGLKHWPGKEAADLEEIAEKIKSVL